MKILDKYLIREMIAPFVVGMFTVLILWIGNVIYNSIGFIRGRGELLPVFLEYVLLKSMAFVILSLSAGSMFGSAVAVSRLTRDCEITVMRMAGVSVRRIFVPFLIAGVLVSGFAYFVQEKGVPWAELRSQKLFFRLFNMEAMPPAQADVFFAWQGYRFFIREVHGKGRDAQLVDVSMWELPAGKGYPMWITARSATWRGGIITLRDGVIHEIGQDGFTTRESKFETQRINLKQEAQDLMATPSSPGQTPEQMSAAQLGRYIRLMEKAGAQVSHMKVDYYLKLSTPLSAIILILCIAPLALRFGRHSSFAGVLMGVVVIFLYWNVILFAKLFGQEGWMQPALAGWSQVILFSVAGAILVWKAE